MKIGLIDVDGHGKKKMWGATVYPNLALCKLAAYHKNIGDTVEWYDLMFGGEYDVVYMSKVFNFSPDYAYHIHAKTVVKGGTGYDIHSQLPSEVDDMQPDLSIYPALPPNTSYGYLTRGCPNKCPWCVVPIKEGNIKPYWDIERVAHGMRNVILMDNNILAAGDYCREQLDKIISLGLHVDFNQALDARLVNEENAKQLASIKWVQSRIRFGCDTHKQIEECERAMSLISGNGFKGEYFLYAMIGGVGSTLEECYERVMYWWERNRRQRKTKNGNRIYPYAQPYRDPKKANIIPQWQKDMAHWCNNKSLCESFPFEEFEPRKGFKCEQYFSNNSILYSNNQEPENQLSLF